MDFQRPKRHQLIQLFCVPNTESTKVQSAFSIRKKSGRNINPEIVSIKTLNTWPLDHPETTELLKLLLNYLFNVGNIDDVDAFIEAGKNRLFGPLRSEVMTIAEKLKIEGKIEGKLEAKQEIALVMLREGTDTAFITKVTGLSVADIERLRASLDKDD